MKKIITLLALFSVTIFYGQQKIAEKVNELLAGKASFEHFTPLEINNSPRDNKAGVVTNATFATINIATVQQIAAAKPQTIEIDIPYNGGTVTMQLYRNEFFTSSFHIDTDTQRNITYEKGAYYSGIVKGDNSSVASFSFFNEEMKGMASSKTLANLVVDRLTTENNLSDYIIYSDVNLAIPNTFLCSAKDPEQFGVKSNETTSTSSFDNIYGVKMYFELDNELYKKNSFSAVLTSNWMTAVFNNIQTLYANDNISISLNTFFIWTTLDPYSTNTNSEQNLTQFRQNAAIDGDLGQLIGIDPGGQGGLAYIRALCGLKASYCDVDFEYEDVPVYSWTIEAMTHEIGHNVGSPHTHACAWNGNNTPIDVCGPQAGYDEGCTVGTIPYEEGGTIMSYCHLVGGVGVNLSNGFGPQPRDLIVDYINSRFCLEPLSIDEETFSDFKYYPNPSTGIINISAASEIDVVSVYNVAGQLLYSERVSSSSATIDISSLSEGIYFVRAVNGNKQSNFRIVKQN